MIIYGNKCNLAIIEYFLKEMEMEFMREHYHTNILYGFKVKLNQEAYLQRLQLAYGKEDISRAIVFSWFTEFHRC